MAGASAEPRRQCEGLALLESVRRILLVEWSWNLHTRRQEGKERERVSAPMPQIWQQ